MKHLAGLCAVIVLLLVSIAPALAKESPDKVTITGPGLASPIEITDPDIVEDFNPWKGQFIDWARGRVTDIPPVDPRYEVLIHVKGNDGRFQVIYAFEYAPNPSSAPGYIYLPDRDDTRYDLNARTILRPTGWQYASADSDSVISRILKEYATVPASRARAPHSIEILKNPWAVALAFAVTAAGAAAWLIRRMRPTPG
ncbi:MAG: hypothetical protein M5U01_14270 [Ardenticatenaceae bacterium]|nr:hypothetical protein [Ardenticatenaceae bacterium]HBY97608.1 hypothetical protein [Chloroflexota bacterium]